MSQTAAVLRTPGITRLSAGGLASEVGDWMMFIALPLFVLQLTDSPLVTATVFAVQLLPTVVVGPLAGVVVDRLDPWWLMASVALGQAAVLLCLLAVDTRSDLWLLYLVIAVQAVLATVIEPCRMVTASALVRAEQLPSATTLMGLVSSLARLVGAPVGGLVLGLAGIDGVLLATVALYLLTAVVFAAPGRPPRTVAVAVAVAVDLEVASPEAAGVRTALAGLVADWADGLRVVARTPPLRRIMAVTACAATAQGAFIVLFVVFVTRDLGGDEADVGTLRGVQAIGALAGGALLTVLVRRVPTSRLLGISLATFGALSLCIWNAPLLSSDLAVYIALFIAIGAPGLALMTCLLALLQAHTTPGARGRVLSTFYAVHGGVQALGMLLAGLVGTGAGLTAALQVQGLLYLTGAALTLTIPSATRPEPHPRRRRLPTEAHR